MSRTAGSSASNFMDPWWWCGSVAMTVLHCGIIEECVSVEECGSMEGCGNVEESGNVKVCGSVKKWL